MALELQQLRQVVALAEHRSFVRAAAALHISQPALSRSIQHVEQRFGSALFVRSSGGVVPTDLGRLYIERSRDLLRMADELEAEAVGHSQLRSGRVDVGGGPYPTDSLLSPACARFVEAFPRVTVQLHSGNWDELVQRLRARALDFFVAETSVLAREPDLDVVPLPVQHALYFFARAEHPLASQRDVRAADVFAWPFVTPSRIPPRVLDPLHCRAPRGLGTAAGGATFACHPVQRAVGHEAHRRALKRRQWFDPAMHRRRTGVRQVRAAGHGVVAVPAIRNRQSRRAALDPDRGQAAGVRAAG